MSSMPRQRAWWRPHRRALYSATLLVLEGWSPSQMPLRVRGRRVHDDCGPGPASAMKRAKPAPLPRRAVLLVVWLFLAPPS